MLQGKLGENDTKLAQVESIVSAYDKELNDLKETIKRCGQAIYNMGFTNGENLCSAIVFKARPLRFFKGWMAAVNALNFPESSSFRDPAQIPLPNDLPIQAPTKE